MSVGPLFPKKGIASLQKLGYELSCCCFPGAICEACSCSVKKALFPAVTSVAIRSLYSVRQM